MLLLGPAVVVVVVTSSRDRCLLLLLQMEYAEIVGPIHDGRRRPPPPTPPPSRPFSAMPIAQPGVVQMEQAAAIVMIQMEQMQAQHPEKKRRRRKSELDGTELFYCPAVGCEKAFASHAGLYLHKRNKHAGIVVKRQKLENCANPFVCPYPGCGKHFVSAGGLCLHRQAKHPDEPRPTCEVTTTAVAEVCEAVVGIEDGTMKSSTPQFPDFAGCVR